MWIPVQMRSSIRQVSHSKFRRPDNSLHGPDSRATYMEIACIWLTIRTIISFVRTREALIWKLGATEVRPSWRGSNQERISAKFWKVDHTVVRLDALWLLSEQSLVLSSQTLIWTYSLQIEVPRLENNKNSVLNSLVIRELYCKVIVLS